MTLFSSCLFAVVAEYNVSTMGINVASLTMSVNESQIIVSTRSKSGTPFVPLLNNTYNINLAPNYLPLTYYREIHQKGIDEKVKQDYLHKSGIAYLQRGSDVDRTKFLIKDDSRDLFSLLAFISSGNLRKADYNVDANGKQWIAHVIPTKSEVIRTDLGKFNCNKFTITFTPLSNQKTPYVDMVTFNFINAETKATIWVGDHGLPLRAIVDKKSMRMKWEIVRIKP